MRAALVVAAGWPEVSAAARLSHPNVVTVFDSGSDGELHYLVMEHVAG